MQSTAHVIPYRTIRPFPLLVVREDIASNAQSAPPPPDPESALHWASVHERLLSLGKERAAHERDVCRWLLAAERLAVHTRAGYASLREYAERVVGLNARQTEERLRVGRALVDLPLLDGALASGELCWSAVRELTRVATAQTEATWLAWARNRRAHQIEKAVAARRPGDGPHDRSDASLIKHRLVFDVRAETLALFRDVQAAVRVAFGRNVDDDTVLYEVARRALGGPTDEGRASYQVAVTRCNECGRTSIDAGGETHRVDEAVADMAACDAQEVATGDGSRAARADDCDDASPHMGASRPKPRTTQTIPP